MLYHAITFAILAAVSWQSPAQDYPAKAMRFIVPYPPGGASDASPEYARRLNAEVAAIIKQPDMQERWTQMALSAVDNTPEQFSAWLGEQAEQWGRLIKEAGVKAE